MQFNARKCVVMHLGKSNKGRQYTMNNTAYMLDVVEVVKDLGVWISRDLKVSNQCGKDYAKVNKLLGVLNRAMEFKSVSIILRLYKTLIRPHVECCTSTWSPYYVKDKELIEKLQHRFTKLIPEVANLSYCDRLHRLGLWTLEERRIRADLVEVFKLIRGISSSPFNTFLT